MEKILGKIKELFVELGELKNGKWLIVELTTVIAFLVVWVLNWFPLDPSTSAVAMLLMLMLFFTAFVNLKNWLDKEVAISLVVILGIFLHAIAYLASVFTSLALSLITSIVLICTYVIIKKEEEWKKEEDQSTFSVTPYVLFITMLVQCILIYAVYQGMW